MKPTFHIINKNNHQQTTSSTRLDVAATSSSATATDESSFTTLNNDENNTTTNVQEKDIIHGQYTHQNSPSPKRTTVASASTVQQEQKTLMKKNKKNNHRLENILASVDINHDLSFLSDNEQQLVNEYDIFCNRECKLSNIQAIGFDMDYTLAQYKMPAFDQLAFEGAKQKLVYEKNYPPEVLNFTYDPSMWVRGLIIDTERGNFLKTDRHQYVRIAYHGTQEIDSNTRKYHYLHAFNKIQSFSDKSYVNMDTLFQFVDAHLFALLIDLKDRGGGEETDDDDDLSVSTLDHVTYREMYLDLRECVDLCHRDGVIKDEVARHPEKYLVHDPGMVPMLQQYREAGVKVFLLTNSYWEYTQQVMNFLYHGTLMDERTKGRNEWLNLFDLVIVGSCKPAYMVDPYLNLFRVRPEDGSLLNTDGLFEIEALGRRSAASSDKSGAELFLEQGKTFQGGNWKHLEALLEIQAGERILYVGDHLYSDVLRSKRTLGWRSAFVVPELEKEMKTYVDSLPLFQTILELRKLRNDLSNHADSIRMQLRKNGSTENAVATTTLEQKLNHIEKDDVIIKDKLSELLRQWHESFHPIWGAMFKTGYQDSRFAFYVQNYACLYTSRASNLGRIFPSRDFRTTSEMLPHDKLLTDEYNTLYDMPPANY